MNIKEFKEGDVITRNEPVIYEHSENADGSWLGDKFTFLAVDEESKIIFLRREGGSFDKELYEMSYARERWDEGWCRYPTSLLEKVKKMCKGEK